VKAQCDRCKEIVPLTFRAQSGGIEVTCPSCDATYFVAETAAPAPAPAPVAGPVAADIAPPASSDQMTCPKCGDVQKPAQACRRCGLIIARWTQLAQAVSAGASAGAGAGAAAGPSGAVAELTPGVVVDPPPEAAASPAAGVSADISIADAQQAAALWARCQEAWHDSTRHQAFLVHCGASGAFAYAAGRYRAAQKARPDDPVAAAGLKQVRQLAEQALVPRATGGARPSVDMPGDAYAKGGLRGLWRRDVAFGRAILVVVVLLFVVIAGWLILDHMQVRRHTRPAARVPPTSPTSPTSAPPPPAAVSESPREPR
jgi:hypothetical protein